MAYSQQTWGDGAGAGTPVSASRLNHMEAGIGAAASIVHRPINVSEAYGRDDTAVRAAIAAASSTSRSLYLTSGDFTVSGNLTFTWAPTIKGDDGIVSRINITDGGVILDATASTLVRPTLRDLRIRRIGTVAGPALHMKGGTAGKGIARITATNLHCSSILGEALLYEGSYLGTFTGCYFESSVYGIRGILSSDSSTGTNALVFLGGESNGNQYGWDFDRPSGVAFYGFCTEGNYQYGGSVHGVARGFVYHGGYFELNVGPDIKVDCNAGSGGILIEANTFFCGGAAKTESVLLNRGRVAVNNNIWVGLVEGDGDVAIRVTETTSPVSGEARNNMRDDDGTLVAYTAGGVAFNVTQIGKITKAPNTVSAGTLIQPDAGIERVLHASQAVDVASIAANSEATFTVTVTGAAVGDDCSVSSSILEAGLSVKSWGVTATDTVSICLRNNTGSAIDPSARTWRVRVFR